MKKTLRRMHMHTRDVINDWTSRGWHKTHNWKSGTGKYIKRLLNRKTRHDHSWEIEGIKKILGMIKSSEDITTTRMFCTSAEELCNELLREIQN